MIKKVEGTKNGYILDKSSKDEDLQKIIKEEYNGKIKCLICNKRMSKNFNYGLFGSSYTTINNKVPDNIFYLNGFF